MTTAGTPDAGALPGAREYVSVREALRVPNGRRAAGLALAILFEVLLVLVLLTLGRERRSEVPVARPPVSFELSEEQSPATPAPAPEPSPATQPTPERPLEETRVKPDQPTPLPAPRPIETPIKVPEPLIELPRNTTTASDLRALPSSPRPSSPKRKPAGPPAPAGGGGGGDTPVVGSAPNGEKLYAAAWYREPYDEELRGYLSTATGPGWALIACKTVPDFRVDDCVALDEYPSGSRLARAVLAAAWQFRVRPPQIGGRLQVGEWVRIRIDYTERRQR